MKKVFVSHSTKDKEVVDIFMDKILKLGLAFTSDDIAYTSREDTGVRTGNDIKAFIKENISTCDFVFFMISENYIQSQVCLNEMGAAWATERKVIPIVFPNIGFDSIGWLYNVNKGIKLTNTYELDSVFEEVNDKYSHTLKVSAWNRYKDEFIGSIESKFSEPKNNEIQLSVIEEELDLLDCREAFNKNIVEYEKCYERMTNALNEFSEKTTRSAKQLNNISNNINSSPAQIRTILMKAAHDNDALSNVFDNEIPIAKDSFDQVIFYGIKMREIAPLDDENTIEEEQRAVIALIEAMQDTLSSAIDLKTTIEDIDTKLDKTYNKSKKRLLICLERIIEFFEFCINKSNELLNYT